jgi:hypothetical protein
MHVVDNEVLNIFRFQDLPHIQRRFFSIFVGQKKLFVPPAQSAEFSALANLTPF